LRVLIERTDKEVTMGRLLSLAAIILACAHAADASPILLEGGDTAIFNFDFSAAGASPAPPYALMFIDPVDTLLSGTGTTSFRYFGELDGKGAFAVGADDPVLLDGIFSLVAIVSGTLTETLDPYAIGYLDTGATTERVYPESVSVTPEPATLSLFGGALLAVALRRRAICRGVKPR
jgi:hypothetical protein